MTEVCGKNSPATRHGCASCAVPRSLVEPARKNRARQGPGAKREASEYVLLLFGGEQGKKPSLQLFADVWLFDPDTLDCSYLGEAPPSFTKRSYFTATYLDGAVWLVGGKTEDDIVTGNTFWKYSVREGSWEQLAVEGDGDGRLTRRTAHGACVSPWDERTIVIFGGYSVREQRGVWMSDVFEIHVGVNNGRGSRRPRISFEKEYNEKYARAYMTFDASNGVCISLFGRKGSQTVRDACLMYDEKRELRVIKVSSKPPPRYNHRTSTCADGSLVVCGGDLAGTLALVRYDAGRKLLQLDTLQVGVRKSHGQLVDTVPQHATDDLDTNVSVHGNIQRAKSVIAAKMRVSLIGGYDLGAGEPEVDQVEATAGDTTVVRTKLQTYHDRKTAKEVRELRKLLVDKEQELATKSQALEEALQEVQAQHTVNSSLKTALQESNREKIRANRILAQKSRELDEMTKACNAERSRVEDKARELDELEQQRDLQALRYNSELDQVHAEYKADLRKKDEQMKVMERSAASAAQALRAQMDKMQWEWEAERVERHVEHVKELNERSSRVEELIQEKKDLKRRLEEREKEFEAARDEAAARLRELEDGYNDEIAALRRRIEEGKEALARKVRENEDEKSRVRASLARISADLTNMVEP